ncbi:hypothetical protein [Nocardia carnea]|uniref:hypothetical protein n=1 Tax=Nocardia carnea TaxID=37328 RepID=UPI00245755D8|nr:hypothetical protein [Nocardia carnea]
MRQYDAETTATIENGCSYYIGKNKIHSADCPTLTRVLWAEQSWLWVEETDDPESIAHSYEELFDRRGDGFRIPGELVTRKDAGQSILKRCKTCAPDVPAHVPTWPSKKVTGLGVSDLGRLLHGHPIESILYEPGSVTVRTSQAVRRFDVTDAVQLDVPAAASEH